MDIEINAVIYTVKYKTVLRIELKTEDNRGMSLSPYERRISSGEQAENSGQPVITSPKVSQHK